ncbi:magnesium-translocating P-type ATPase [Methylocystis sp. Sn-Cys]|uniref:magnesium-translocating P-type ATPase n=1 Tax=Methylocystis sp. Sn-Cys TaxID=1701263 RepID=UPI001923E209|nr:magnesium-translocating P-type ATPase [Methylocystis sp. Sn-Cys]MBL1258593.1 magnesium-translocating P-type ATPase [Methylocystis sp. Sn-Cys]
MNFSAKESQAVHSMLERAASNDVDALTRDLEASPQGLSEAEAARRLRRHGSNRVASETGGGVFRELARNVFNPLNGLLLTLAVASWALSDRRAAIVISAMVILSVLLAFVQEHRSNAAAAKLRAMVRTHASVRRPERVDSDDPFVEISLEELVPGDIVRLAAGDMIPADLRMLTTKDLFVNQSALTGESMPVEKFAHRVAAPVDLSEADNLAFMGSNVVSGYGEAIVVVTGRDTYFGAIADKIVDADSSTAFDESVRKFTWLMISFMAVMAPLVFFVNGYLKGDWLGAFLFAVSVAVGLTPEMLPMIVTVNLAKGAMAISREKVIVKRLNAMQNFGAMDVLCTDKTGTLTQDRIILKRHLDIFGEDSDRVLEFAYLNSHFQSGLRNLLDVAVLQHAEIEERLSPQHSFKKIDEIPFDFERRRLSVVVERDDGERLLICKGAVEELFAVATHFEAAETEGALDLSHLEAAKRETARLNADGFRVIAVAYKSAPREQSVFTPADEKELTLLGYIAFLDPPKDSAAQAIADLHNAGVAVKILTGDNDIVTRKICRDVGLDVERLALGAEIEAMDDATLAACVSDITVFAKLSPPQKARVVAALRANGHVVGYLGDGINDGPALKAGDVGISVDSAVDIARESADIILLEKSLSVLNDGVVEGRKVFANILKYVRMGASSNFGNMFSVLGASVFLPFLPMTPIQILTNNLLYDFSQTAIPTDEVDEEFIAQPRKWDIGGIAKFMLYLGPASSVFDYATFILMVTAFDGWNNPALFQTGWFVESLFTQTLIIHVIRTKKIPFIESRASTALLLTTVLVCLIGAALPYSPFASAFGFVPLPASYWPAIGVFLIGYAILAHIAKTAFFKRFGD